MGFLFNFFEDVAYEMGRIPGDIVSNLQVARANLRGSNCELEENEMLEILKKNTGYVDPEEWLLEQRRDKDKPPINKSERTNDTNECLSGEGARGGLPREVLKQTIQQQNSFQQQQVQNEKSERNKEDKEFLSVTKGTEEKPTPAPEYPNSPVEQKVADINKKLSEINKQADFEMMSLIKEMRYQLGILCKALKGKMTVQDYVSMCQSMEKVYKKEKLFEKIQDSLEEI